MNAMFSRIAGLLDAQGRGLDYLQSPLLLAIRLFWGWQFMATGWGKLQNIEQVAAWFGNDLGIPMPLLNAYMAAGTELVGGACLLLGLGGRVMTIPLVVTMCVAYATSDREALVQIWSDPDAFLGAAPFLFLFASTLVLVFGPGAVSVDALIARWWRAQGVGAAAPAK